MAMKTYRKAVEYSFADLEEDFEKVLGYHVTVSYSHDWGFHLWHDGYIIDVEDDEFPDMRNLYGNFCGWYVDICGIVFLYD